MHDPRTIVPRFCGASQGIALLALAVAHALGGCANPSPPGSPATIGDAPAIDEHTRQSEIDAGLLSLDELLARGEQLMTASFNTLDGAGRPEATGTGDVRLRRELADGFNRISGPDANACSACHHLPRPGGGGDNVANVFVLAQQWPFVNFDGGPGDGGRNQTLASVGNERNTLGMFGSGFIELLAREMTADLHAIRDGVLREAAASGEPATRTLVTKGIEFGSITAWPNGSLITTEVEGVDRDLVVRPFHQKGVVVSLREFTNHSMNQHHGMQSAERFGDGLDHDADGIADELTRGDITALTLFQATLPVPGQVIPADPGAQQAIQRGEELFLTVGCAVCHVPTLPLRSPVFTEPNPYNPPRNLRLSEVPTPYAIDLTTDGPTPRLSRGPDGSVLVPAFTDLKRHRLGAQLDNEQLAQAGVATDAWLTRKLWGMASEPPFLHHGRATLISEAILLHGGEALDARNSFAALPASDQAAVVEFLKTLQVLPEGATELRMEAATLAPTGSGLPVLQWGLAAGVALALGGLLVAWAGRKRRHADGSAHTVQ